MQLIIVESPTKARTLGRFLGMDYVVEATMGHIKDLPKSKLGVDVENNFKPDYVEVEKRKDVINTLKKKSENANVIYIASDPDREGEAIAQHVADVLSSNSKFKRITFHEITQQAVEDAIAHPMEINQNLVDAQTARRVLDRLVGYKLSPILWKKVRRGLSAGRVQSVAVRLIVEKEREIEKFKSLEYWEVFAKLGVLPLASPMDEKFVVQLINQEVKTKDESDKILADLEKSEYKVSDVRKRQVIKNPFPPFTTSTMTQAASRIMGWSSKRTMSIAQKLYEEGLITYHRTDSLNLSIAAIDKAREFIGREFGSNYLPEKPRVYKTTSKVAQEAHEAIRPTNISYKIEVASGKWEEDEKKLYDLIWKRFVACQMSPSVYDETTIEVEASSEITPGVKSVDTPGVYLLRASGQIMNFDGWRRVIPAAGQKDELAELPLVSKDEKLDLIKTWGEQKFTQPPARYNEASLIKTLEKLGIGRPSTYAPTINTIQVRSYVEKNDAKQFLPTSIGIAVNDFLMLNFADTFDYQFTAHMEGNLDEVANGKLSWVDIIREFWDPFVKKLVDVEKNSKRVKIEVEKLGRKCPDCAEGELVVRTGRFGKFISCDKFPDCKHTEKYLEKVGVKCPDCKDGDIIVKKTGKGRKFFGCSNYPKCKYASWKSPKKEEEK